MKLKTRFALLLAGGIAVVVVAGITEIYSSFQTRSDLRHVDALDQLVQKLFHLQNVSSGYAEYPTERSRRQRTAVFNQFSRRFAALRRGDEHEDSEEMARLAQNLVIIGSLFEKLDELDQLEAIETDPATIRLRSVLTSQIRVTEQAMAADLRRWYDQVYERMRGKSSRLASFSLIVQLMLVGFLVSGALIARRAVLGPIYQIESGLQNVAAGQLGFRLNSTRADELGELARAFDAMSDRLQEHISERERSSALLRELVEGVPDAMFIKDESGRYQLLNRAGAELIGQTPETVIGNTDQELFQPQSAREVMDKDKEIIQGGLRQAEEEAITDVHGNSKVFSVTKGPLRDSHGNIVGLFGISRNITDRVQAENEVRQLNEQLEERVRQRTTQLEAANKELESFAYSVSHDLRAPLRSIDGFSRIVLEDHAETLQEEGRRYLERIRENAQKMDELIQHLLSFSRLSRQPLERHLTDITDIVTGAWEEVSPLSDGRQIELTIKPLPHIAVDRKLLKIAFVNLLGNAVKYTSQEQRPRIEVGVMNDSDPPVIYVKDNGAGFNMAYADKAFEVFQRLHSADEYAGSGVGLATVQRIIYRHGGKIWVEAEEAKGATFFLTLGESDGNS